VSQVTVYQFTIYDGWNDEFRLSSRWATHEAIESTRIGIIHEHTGTLIDQAYLDKNGMTARGFDPASPDGRALERGSSPIIWMTETVEADIYTERRQ
jgi:hypothetical protein